MNTVVQVFLPKIAMTNKIADFADLSVSQMPDPLPEVYDLGSLRRFMSVFPWREQNVALDRYWDMTSRAQVMIRLACTDTKQVPHDTRAEYC